MIAVFLPFAGCGGHTQLKGKVVFEDGSPLAVGMVIFDDGTMLARAPIQPNGTLRLPPVRNEKITVSRRGRIKFISSARKKRSTIPKESFPRRLAR
ncbi:MAG: hypothetical protein LBJ67_13520 [Planctomycetaceae bacterium]|nr:hypothetical protein [Planctomycetaceae bacterium]